MTNSALLLKYCDNGGLRWKNCRYREIFNDEYTLRLICRVLMWTRLRQWSIKNAETGDKPAFGHNFQSRCMGGVGSGGRVIYLTS